jgi:hypothetical protein
MVTLTIFSDEGVVLGQQAFEGVELLNNSFQEFTFAPIQGRKGQRLRLRLDFTPLKL